MKVKYEPYVDCGVCGFKATHPDGRVEFVYLNPSVDDESPNVFVYIGARGDPADDGALFHVNLFESQKE